DASLFSDRGFIRVGTGEIIAYSSKSGNTLTLRTRGALGSTAKAVSTSDWIGEFHFGKMSHSRAGDMQIKGEAAVVSSVRDYDGDNKVIELQTALAETYAEATGIVMKPTFVHGCSLIGGTIDM